jgi:hypothetical protein
MERVMILIIGVEIESGPALTALSTKKQKTPVGLLSVDYRCDR